MSRGLSLGFRPVSSQTGLDGSPVLPTDLPFCVGPPALPPVRPVRFLSRPPDKRCRTVSKV